MPTPAERRIARIPLIGRPIKRGLQLDRLAQKERIRRPKKYAFPVEPLKEGGKRAIADYARRLSDAKKIGVNASKLVVSKRAERLRPKKAKKGEWYDASVHSNYGEREDTD